MNVHTLHQRAVGALNRGEYRAAAEAARALLEQDAQFADGWFIMGMVAAANLRMAKALELVEQAAALAPDNVEYLAQLAKLHTMLSNDRAAQAVVERALPMVDAQPCSPLTLDTLGVVLSKLSDFAGSRALLQRVVQAQDDNPQFHFNLASTEQFLGNADAAALAYERAIALDPGFCRAHWALAELRKNAPASEQLAPLEALLDTPLRADDALYVCHALYYEYEKRGRFADAFDVLERGKRRRAGQISYSVQADLRLMECLAEQVPDRTATGQGASNLFVVGMPRTGTTLVERMLASHGQAASLGERQDFALALRSVVETDAQRVLDEAIVRDAAQVDPALIAERYQARLGNAIKQIIEASGEPESAHGAAPTRFIDKMPLNFLLVGFILQALPEARVVCLRRQPMDTVMSNYRQLFAINFSYYNYQYDLGDTAHYFAGFDRLMTAWRQRFGDRFIELDYEALVAQPKPVVADLLKRLDLPWDDNCLNFHEHKGAVSTASTMQVREPVYDSAVARWRHYADRLAPVSTIFDRFGIEWNAEGAPADTSDDTPS